MNKRIWLILIPLFALLFNSYGGDHYSLSLPPNFSGSSITAVKSTYPLPTDLKKEEKKINKNAIRIKARDSAFAINLLSQWTLTGRRDYFSKPAYCIYGNHVLHADISGNDLRGPPCSLI